MCKQKAVAGVMLALACMATMSGCEKAPEPSVKEGRFHFSVTYEVDGEVETISSVYVCKFIKSGMHLDGCYIDWDSYVEDRELESIFPEDHYECIVLKTNEDGTIFLDLNLDVGYFMSEPGNDDESKPFLYMEYNEVFAESTGIYGTGEIEVLESYGVKLISYEYDAPIQNSYK